MRRYIKTSYTGNCQKCGVRVIYKSKRSKIIACSSCYDMVMADYQRDHQRQAKEKRASN